MLPYSLFYQTVQRNKLSKTIIHKRQVIKLYYLSVNNAKRDTAKLLEEQH